MRGGDGDDSACCKDRVPGFRGGNSWCDVLFRFLLLLLGKFVTARIGAAKSQAFFWVARNMAALCVASASLWYALGMHSAVLVSMVAGAFMFYGFRAAGVVMSQPLTGEISSESELPKVVARSGGLFYSTSFIALAIVCLVVRWSDSMWTLSGIIAVGAVLGVLASRFVNRIHETSAIMLSARKPIRSSIVEVLRESSLRRLLWCGFASNLAIIMVMPVSVLMIKKGYGRPDSVALLYALMRFAGSAAMSFFTGRIIVRIGPRKLMLVAYVMLMGLCVLWTAAPASGVWVVPCSAFVFLALGACRVGVDHSTVNYFLQTVEPGSRVAASILLNTITGVLSGVAGMVVSGGLLWFLQRNQLHEGMWLFGSYRAYFVLAFLLLSPLVGFIMWLEPLPMEKRRDRRSWWSW